MVRDHTAVVRQRGEYPRVGGAPRDRVDRVLVLVVGANQLVAVLERLGRVVLCGVWAQVRAATTGGGEEFMRTNTVRVGQKEKERINKSLLGKRKTER